MRPINGDYLLSELYDLICCAEGETLLAYKKVFNMILDAPIINLGTIIESQKWHNNEEAIRWREREDRKIAEEYRKPKGGMDNGGDW